MGKNQSASNLVNIIQTNNGNISFVSGSTTLMQISSSGAITTTGIISGSNALSASYAISASNALNASTASFAVNATSASWITGSNVVGIVTNTTSASFATQAQTASFANTFTVNSTLTAQTLVVQTITSSIVYSSGSNIFGNNISNTQTFTGSVLITGSIGIGINFPTSKLHIINNTDGFVGRFTGGAASTVTAGIFANSTTGFASIGVQSAHAFRIFTSDADRLTVTSDGNIGIGTTSPTQKFHIVGSTGLPATSGISQPGTLRLQLSGYGTVLDFGGEGPATGKQWIQVTDANNLSITYPLLLNPNGGSVGIGTTNPTNTRLQVSATGVNQTVSAVEIAIAGSGTFQRGIRMLNGGMVQGESLLYMVGRNSASKNTGQVYFYYDGDGSNNNRLSLGLYAVDDVLNVTAAGLVGIGTTNPAGQLSGTIGLSIVNATNAALGLSNGTNHWLNYLSGTTYRIWNNSVSETMTILLNGNIGIGTSSPGFKLDITSGVPDVLRVTNTGSATGNNPTAQFLNTNGDHSWGICAEFRVGNGSGTDRSSILFSHGYDTNTWGLGFGYTDSTYFRINKDQGPYGGGWGTTLFSMDRSGNYSFAGSNVSDRRNKKDITYIEDSQLSIILKLKPASFNKRSPGKDEYSDHVHTGFIAQDVLEENIPNLVHGNEEEGYGLDYDGILALTVKALQESNAKITILEEILQRNNIQ